MVFEKAIKELVLSLSAADKSKTIYTPANHDSRALLKELGSSVLILKIRLLRTNSLNLYDKGK
jgi:hypothetical protein